MINSLSKPARLLLWPSSDWGGSIVSSITTLLKTKPNRAQVDHAIELALLAEQCCLDTSQAIAAALWAFRADESQSEALDIVNRLVGNLSDPTHRAKIYGLFSRVKETQHSAQEEGVAWLDAGQFDRAVRPLLNALSKNPNDKWTKLALSVAQCEWPDLRAQISEFQNLARNVGPKQKSSFYMAAFWLSRQLDSSPQQSGQLLQMAYHANPSELTLRSLETWYGRFDILELVPIIDSLSRRSTPEQAYCFRWRGAAKLVLNKIGLGAGFELALRTLRTAYEEGVAILPGHIALLEFVAKRAFVLRREDEILKLVESGLALRLSKIEIGFLAWIGIKASSNKKTLRSILAFAFPDHPNAAGVRPLERSFREEDLSDSALPTQNKQISKKKIAAAKKRMDEEELIPGMQSFSQPVYASSLIKPQTPNNRAELAASFSPEAKQESLSSIEPTLMIQAQEPQVQQQLGAELRARVDGESSMKSLFGDGPDLGGEAPSKQTPSPGFSLIPKAALHALSAEQQKRETLKSKLAALGRQRAERHLLSFDVEIHVDEHRENSTVRDLSESGIFLVTSSDFELGSKIEVVIAFMLDAVIERVAIRVCVIRKVDGGYGCQLETVPDHYLHMLQQIAEEKSKTNRPG